MPARPSPPGSSHALPTLPSPSIGTPWHCPHGRKTRCPGLERSSQPFSPANKSKGLRSLGRAARVWLQSASKGGFEAPCAARASCLKTSRPGRAAFVAKAEDLPTNEKRTWRGNGWTHCEYCHNSGVSCQKLGTQQCKAHTQANKNKLARNFNVSLFGSEVWQQLLPRLSHQGRNT